MADLPPPPRLMTRRQSDSDWDWDGSSREGSPDPASASAVRRAARRWPDDPGPAQISLHMYMASRDRDRDDDPPPDHARLRIRGRQARLELVMRMAADRHAELHRLSHHRAVSDFPHRNRIHALLRGRFLRNGDDDRRPPSTAATELGQLRQRHSVSGLRSLSTHYIHTPLCYTITAFACFFLLLHYCCCLSSTSLLECM